MVNYRHVTIISSSNNHYWFRAVQQTLLPNKATKGCNILITELTSVSIYPYHVSLETLKIWQLDLSAIFSLIFQQDPSEIILFASNFREFMVITWWVLNIVSRTCALYKSSGTHLWAHLCKYSHENINLYLSGTISLSMVVL